MKDLTPEQQLEIAKRMYNPVKICDPYLPSKTHNDIIRRANPNWSDESLGWHMKDESQYFKAVELELQCKYEQETLIETRGKRRFPRNYRAKCIFGVDESDLKFAAGIGSTPEEALKKAREKAIFYLERKLLNGNDSRS